jgi:hypothetical protein
MREAEIKSLESRLQWEQGGPLADLSSRGLDALTAGLGALASEVRRQTEKRPIVSLLVAFELGFATGRWGPRRAQH